MRRQRRFLGDLDAATDKQFGNHFVESVDLTRLLEPHSHIVYGSKGVGKTALRRALTELNRDSFYTTKTIDLDKISFSQVHEALSKLKDTTRTEVPTLARNTWRNVLAMYCLEAILETLPAGHPLAVRIKGTLQSEGFENEDSNDRLVNFIDWLFNRVAEAGTQSQAPTPLGLNAKQRKVINVFPAVHDVRGLLEDSTSIVKESEKVIVVCLDGFDSIIDHSPDSRRAIFAGLIDAIFKCSKDPLFHEAFCFKAFLPQELTDEARTAVWDADKFIQYTHYLRWSEADFQTLIQKRLATYAKTRSSSFLEVWHEFMPDKIRNETHRIDEPSFNYIIRHTLYRPRQLLAHVQAILDRWDEQSDSHRVDPSFIPRVVASMNQTMATGVVNQLGVKYTNLDLFMKSWNGSANVLPMAEFRARISKHFDYAPAEIKAFFSDLYNVGVVGIVPKGSQAKGPQLRVRFGSVGDRFEKYVQTADDAEFVALSPMFHEYCGCVPSEFGAIIPIADSLSGR